MYLGACEQVLDFSRESRGSVGEVSFLARFLVIQLFLVVARALLDAAGNDQQAWGNRGQKRIATQRVISREDTLR